MKGSHLCSLAFFCPRLHPPAGGMCAFKTLRHLHRLLQSMFLDVFSRADIHEFIFLCFWPWRFSNAAPSGRMGLVAALHGGVVGVVCDRYLKGKAQLLYPEPEDVFPCDIIDSEHCRPPTSYT